MMIPDTSADTSARPPLILVCGADDNYALPLGVMLHSALARLSPACPVRVFLIDGGLQGGSRRRLERVVQAARADAGLEFVMSDAPGLGGLSTQRWLSSATYLRLLTPDVVPEQCVRALYLDSDLLVQADLDDLWRQDFGGCPVMAVLDDTIRVVAHPEGLPNYADLGLPADAPYFNGGVLVMDLDRWRAEAIHGRVLNYCRDHAALLHYADQDGLNAILAGQWRSLDPQWNLTTNTLYGEQGASSRPLLLGPHLCHFAGQSKPWRPSCTFPVKSDWLRALWRSRWFTAGERARWFASYYARHHALRLRWRLLRQTP